MAKPLTVVLRDIETAISETDKGRSYGGHRHGQFARYASAGYDSEGEYWIAYARLKGRWRVVGRSSTYQGAIRLARARAARG